jgi:hypothetical protein
VEAGGSTITDLSRADSNSYLTDPSLLDRLVTEKQERGLAPVSWRVAGLGSA